MPIDEDTRDNINVMYLLEVITNISMMTIFKKEFLIYIWLLNRRYINLYKLST